ncbi:MAG: protein adenylyltransferase SelO [Porticoccaceae bacterium]
MNPLDRINFDNCFHALDQKFFTRVEPQGFANPHRVATNPDAATLINLEPAQLTSGEFLAWASGNWRAPGSAPLAMVYAGHQFGGYTAQLGDGRGLLLGQVRGPAGLWDIHLKGAGKTPYSRFADGRAVLRSSIREYLGCEALHGLGIATTRALSIVGSDEPVARETLEPGAMLIRLARTHVRFGSFEYFHYRQDVDAVRTLADHVVDTYLPALSGHTDRHVELFRHAVHATALVIAQWQAVGFCHGVMNTDNMSILGDTLDYGPYGFLDVYDPGHICNHSDDGGRYAYNQQPRIGLWNCNALALALSSLIEVESLRTVLMEYEPLLLTTLRSLQRSKLGLARVLADDELLIDDLLALLARNRVDYTLFFRRLSYFEEATGREAVRDLFPDRAAFDLWSVRYGERLALEANSPTARRALMLATNPKYVLRNYMAEIAIRKASDEGDFSEIERLRLLLATPFAEHPDMAQYAGAAPDWGTRLAVSCSS